MLRRLPSGVPLALRKSATNPYRRLVLPAMHHAATEAAQIEKATWNFFIQRN